ncbi:MAG: hypothetical protein OCD76_09295 [Reichenbachiella sp.]
MKTITLFISALLAVSVQVSALNRSAAILIIPDVLEVGSQSKTLSLQHALNASGVPFSIVTQLDSAVLFSVIYFSSSLTPGAFSLDDIITITDYVDNGGVVVAPRLLDPALFSLFGISSSEYSASNYLLTWDVLSDPLLFKYFNTPEEISYLFGDSITGTTVKTIEYTVTNAQAIAEYSNGTSAATVFNSGDGYTYTLGLSFKNMILSYLTNKDIATGSSYSIDFEPDVDMIIFLLKNIYTKHVPYAVTKHSLPDTCASAIIVTHDIDSRTSMEQIGSFGTYEKSMRIQGSYFITTRYIDDARSSDFYSAYVDSIVALKEMGHHIGSHSVGHFPDFASMPMGGSGNTPLTYSPYYSYTDSATHDGSILGELEVSKFILERDIGIPIKSFRAGHLSFPLTLIDALDSSNYTYNSSVNANDVETSFPFRGMYGNKYSGTVSNVFEIPITISDVFGDDPINDTNWLSKVSLWNSITEKYSDNHSPVVLLIHPNRDYKLLAEMSFVDAQADKTFIGFEEYGDFWRDRERYSFSSTLTGNSLTIHIDSSTYYRQSLVIEGGGALDQIVIVYNSDTLTYSSQLFHTSNLLISHFGKQKQTTPIVLNKSYPFAVRISNSNLVISFLSKLVEAQGTVILYNLKGQKIFSKAISFNNLSVTIDFPFEDYGSERYILEIVTPNHKMTKMLVLLK